VSNAPSAANPDEKKLRKWEAKQLDGSRTLGAWEMYRALNDALDEGHDQFELTNRDARLALILMGGLNAALVLMASQTGLGVNLSPLERRIEAAVIGIYALYAIAFLLQAIHALRPAHFRPRFDDWDRTREDFPAGVRYYEDVILRDTSAHWKAWREVTVEQLNAELAVQFHSLCRKNEARKMALRRLYRSLRMMALAFSAIVLLFVIFTLV
jgi:hypothetical protein